MIQCDRCGFMGGSDRFVKATFGKQCPKCRHIVARVEAPAAPVSLVGATPNPDDYLTASFLGIVTPEDVGNEKRSIAPYAEATQLKFALREKSLSPALVQNWKTFYAEWQDFYSSATFIPPTAYKKALEFRFRLSALQTELNHVLPSNDRVAYVPLPNMVAPGAPTDPGNADDPKPTLLGTLDSWSTTAKIGLVVGGGILAWIIYLQAKNAMRMSDSVIGAAPKLLPLL